MSIKTTYKIVYSKEVTVSNVFTGTTDTFIQEFQEEFDTYQDAENFKTNNNNITSDIVEVQNNVFDIKDHTYRFNNSDILDDTVNYELMGFQKDNKEVTKIIRNNQSYDCVIRDFYRYYDKNTMTFSEIIVSEKKYYPRNTIGFPEYELVEISYYSQNDNVLHTKVIETALSFEKSQIIELNLRKSKFSRVAKLFLNQCITLDPVNALYIAFSLQMVLKEGQDYYYSFVSLPLQYTFDNIVDIINASSMSVDIKNALIYLLALEITIDSTTQTVLQFIRDILEV